METVVKISHLPQRQQVVLTNFLLGKMSVHDSLMRLKKLKMSPLDANTFLLKLMRVVVRFQ